MLSISRVIEKHLRGSAAQHIQVKAVESSLDDDSHDLAIFSLLSVEIAEFVEVVNDKLNEKYGR